MKNLKKRLFQIKYGKKIEFIEYWGTCIVGGIIGFVLVFAIIDLLLILQNQ